VFCSPAVVRRSPGSVTASLLINRSALVPFVYSSSLIACTNNSKPHQYVPDRLTKRTQTTKLRHNPKKAIFDLRSHQPVLAAAMSLQERRERAAPLRKVGGARGRPHKSDRISQHNCLIERKSFLELFSISPTWKPNCRRMFLHCNDSFDNR
jgi:hypothetical protein